MEDVLKIPEYEDLKLPDMTQEHYDGIMNTYNEIGGVKIDNHPEFIEVIRSQDELDRSYLYIGETDSEGQPEGLGLRVFNRWAEQGQFKAGKRHGPNKEFWHDGGYYDGNCTDGSRTDAFIAPIGDGKTVKVISEKTLAVGELFKDGILALPSLDLIKGLGQTMWNYSGIEDAYKRGEGFKIDKDLNNTEICIREGHDKFDNNYVYVGEAKNKRIITGLGIRIYSGWIEQGYFQGGRQHGKGKQFWGSDDYYEGTWKNGERDGLFTWTSGDGTKYEITYEAGKWQKENKIE